MTKERPGELKREMKRIRDSRNKHKERNREQALKNRRLQDRNQEITCSRDKWKNVYEKSCEKMNSLKKELLEKLRIAEEEAQQERKKAEEAKKLAEQLQYEMDIALQKKTKNLNV